MNGTIKIITCLSLLMTSAIASASTWQCQVEMSFGKDKPINANIYLSLEMNSIQFKIENSNIEVSPLTTSNGLYDYSKQATTDLSNERITSTRLLRFNSLDGHLVYIDHDANHQMITGTCVVQIPKKIAN